MACDWLSALSLRGMVSPGEETEVELERPPQKLKLKDFFQVKTPSFLFLIQPLYFPHAITVN